MRKNEILICKMFDAKRDGEWEPEYTKMYQRKDMKYVMYQVQKYVLENSNCNDLPVTWCKQITKDKYMIIMKTIKDSKKCKALLEYGFERIA